MKYRLNLIIISIGFYFISIFSLYSQISQGGIPPSYLEQATTNQIDVKEIGLVEMASIIREVERSGNDGTLYKFAKTIPVDFSMNNSGSWTDLADGGRIWRLKIVAHGALALGIYYDQFWLPKGSSLFLYSEDKKQVIGAFTEFNNSESGLFATELIKGDIVYLEYYEPKPVLKSPLIHITEVAYAFRSVNYLYEKDAKGFGDSDPCEVNINCSEGNNWQLQKRGAVRISVKEGNFLGWCSGSLVNNVRQDETPYVLTADHCGGNASASDLNQWVFAFNYEASGCTNPTSSPFPIKSMTGCVKIAYGGNGGNSGSDFYLVELNNNVPDSYLPFFNGWDRTNVSSSSGVSIHHPSGDIMKISTYSTSLINDTWGGTPGTHWRVKWITTSNGHGVTEGGSSGSPIFDSQRRIIGTLTGGTSACVAGGAGPYTGPNKPDYYGKFSYHWDQNGAVSTRRLKDWLDPDNTGAVSLDGIYVGLEEKEFSDRLIIYPNPANDVIYLTMDGSFFRDIQIKVYNILGELIKSYNYDDFTDRLELNVSDLTKGIYLFTIITDHAMTTRKVSVIN